ncbi:hypothetical protein CRUP_005698 [Coryphaenoides rupestris]|nr:hypothetical protein CRUP_005698 [Coryphaenoides rupestris]
MGKRDENTNIPSSASRPQHQQQQWRWRRADSTVGAHSKLGLGPQRTDGAAKVEEELPRMSALKKILPHPTKTRAKSRNIVLIRPSVFASFCPEIMLEPRHQNLGDRLSAAQVLVDLQPRCPVVVDDMSNVATSKYGALPERLYVLQAGKVVYKRRSLATPSLTMDNSSQALNEAQCAAARANLFVVDTPLCGLTAEISRTSAFIQEMVLCPKSDTLACSNLTCTVTRMSAPCQAPCQGQ